MFEPSNLLLEYLNAQPRDMFDVVGALIGYINADPHFETEDFVKAINYVLKNGVTESELFAPFDDKLEVKEDPATWDEDYYSYAIVRLKKNFCKKRIAHVKAIADKLYPKAKTAETEKKPAQQVAAPSVRHTSQTPKKAQSRPSPAPKKTSPGCATMMLSVILCAIAVTLLACIIM